MEKSIFDLTFRSSSSSEFLLLKFKKKLSEITRINLLNDCSGVMLTSVTKANFGRRTKRRLENVIVGAIHMGFGRLKTNIISLLVSMLKPYLKNSIGAAGKAVQVNDILFEIH